MPLLQPAIRIFCMPPRNIGTPITFRREMKLLSAMYVSESIDLNWFNTCYLLLNAILIFSFNLYFIFLEPASGTKHDIIHNLASENHKYFNIDISYKSLRCLLIFIIVSIIIIKEGSNNKFKFNKVQISLDWCCTGPIWYIYIKTTITITVI